MIVGFWKPALQAFGSQEIFCIIKRKFWDRFSCAAEKVTDIGTVQLYSSFPQVTFFGFLADGLKNIFVHDKTS